MTISLHPSRKTRLTAEFSKPYFSEIKQFLTREKESGHTIYPTGNLIFNALDTTPFDDVKVVILGQDPYHGAGEAHGLSFSVPDGVRIPPSLKNIYKELSDDLGIPTKTSGNLISRAQQGVLLLNATLTVRADTPNSHKDIGWQNFTDAIIQILSDEKSNLVFILRGNFAKQKAQFVDQTKHLIITSPHPSPFSANSGFFGSKPFSRTNKWLESKGLTPIIF